MMLKILDISCDDAGAQFVDHSSFQPRLQHPMYLQTSRFFEIANNCSAHAFSALKYPATVRTRDVHYPLSRLVLSFIAKECFLHVKPTYLSLNLTTPNNAYILISPNHNVKLQLNIRHLIEPVFLKFLEYSMTITQLQTNGAKQLHKFRDKSHFPIAEKWSYEKTYCSHAPSVVSTDTQCFWDKTNARQSNEFGVAAIVTSTARPVRFESLYAMCSFIRMAHALISLVLLGASLTLTTRMGHANCLSTLLSVSPERRLVLEKLTAMKKLPNNSLNRSSHFAQSFAKKTTSAR
ncbi:hypothetical protein CSKR_114159 [Clonorchis sinensis]|uniref:Uncharacterized protein n=2 Tax=Clonorchis sinensis TaxID=79923 RepID=A0A8T1MYQ6_CLOSI|nr:hypothetical protein CSKR_114159 [Clonorchis sinensis]GAA55489.1 hypothetical protein CLF_108154 [Clonorchis sinensis]